MMTLQDFLSGWPLLWPSPGHQCQAPHSPAQLDKRTPKKPLGAEDTNSWEMLRKKLLLCLCGWYLILEPLNHPSVAQGTSPPWHLSWGGVESPPWRTFLHCHKHGRVWRNPWKPPRHWEHWSCTRGPCLSSWLALCCCRHIWLFGLVRGCPYVRIILSLQGYSTQELCNPFVWTVAWEATTGQNQMTWGCFFPVGHWRTSRGVLSPARSGLCREAGSGHCPCPVGWLRLSGAAGGICLARPPREAPSVLGRCPVLPAAVLAGSSLPACPACVGRGLVRLGEGLGSHRASAILGL